MTVDSYFELLGQLVTRVLRTHGRFRQSVEESSFYAWTKFYKQGANAPTLRRSVLVALGRFGLDEERLFAVWERVLDPERSRLARDNWRALVHDPQAAAAAFAMAEVNDLVADGLLPAEAGERALRDQAALLAATIAWREDAFASLRVELDDGDGDAADLAARALACGLRVRWQRD